MNSFQNTSRRLIDSAPRSSVRTALMTAALALPLTGLVHAESAPEHGTIALKYLDYQDSQPDTSRIKVQASALSILAPLSGEWSFGGTLTSDSISGASPLYQSSGITPMHDHRRALEADMTRYFSNGALTVGASVSSESDYLSRGLSLQATRSSEDKNTTWTVGLGYNSDIINPTNLVVVDATKQVTALLFGVTQVINSQDIVQVNMSLSLGRGDFSDPYKFADSRPNTKDSRTFMLRWNHFLDSTQGTARLSYRYYTDSWSIDSHTLGFEYVQPLSQGWTVTPLARLYTQSAASFYVNPDASSFPFAPSSDNYSEDQRLSAFGAHTLGLKVTKQLDAAWLVDMKYENYEQRASWRLFGSGSPSQVPFYARSIQLGLSHAF